MSVTAMEMSDPIFKLRCLIIGDNAPFLITASSTLRLSLVKNLIKEQNANHLRGVDAQDLTLWMVRYFQ